MQVDNLRLRRRLENSLLAIGQDPKKHHLLKSSKKEALSLLSSSSYSLGLEKLPYSGAQMEFAHHGNLDVSDDDSCNESKTVIPSGVNSLHLDDSIQISSATALRNETKTGPKKVRQSIVFTLVLILIWILPEN